MVYEGRIALNYECSKCNERMGLYTNERVLFWMEILNGFSPRRAHTLGNKPKKRQARMRWWQVNIAGQGGSLEEGVESLKAVLIRACGRGSRVVWVSDRGLPCHEFEPSTTKDPPCWAALHAKSVES
ncbi:hypothetical protein TNCV_1392791 [Trichonephila clavipes]|nr:hypothetical protein TNCV_1392791 [Trichonephila clavipes]